MKVKILAAPPGSPYSRGDVIDVPEAQAKSWAKAGYAEIVEEAPGPAPPASKEPAKASRKGGK